ncbi:hypothetical protein FACS1894206_08720 [Deltaproteobacteria bacterium]|nr:hypothetical protein FACS1894206_08720 [Deltaproteobacteria bacterium]
MQKLRARLIMLAQYGISLGLFWYVCKDIQFSVMLEGIKGYRLRWALVPCLLLALNYLFNGARLWFISNRQMPYAETLAAALIGLGYNVILPFKAGDMLKAAILGKGCAGGLAGAGAYVVWERGFDVLILLALLFCSLAGNVVSDKALIGLIALCGIVCFVALKQFSGKLHAFYARFPASRFWGFIERAHTAGVDAVGFLWLCKAGVLTLLVWSLYFFYIFSGLVLIGGIKLTLFQGFSVFALTAFGSALPLSPGSVGVFEAAMIYALSLYGIAGEQVVGIVLFLHCIELIPLALAAIFLMSRISKKTTAH